MRAPGFAALVVAVGVVVTVMHVPSAQACSPAAPQTHVIDAAATARDHRAPATPTIGKVMVGRGRPGGGGSCADLASIMLPQAADDQTSPWQMGYRIEVAAGALPPSGLRSANAGAVPPSDPCRQGPASSARPRREVTRTDATRPPGNDLPADTDLGDESRRGSRNYGGSLS